MSTRSRRAMGPGATGTFDRVLRGSLDKLPPEKSNVVSVFLSSGFTDFQHERNVLASEAIPQLRTYCHTKGLDLQVVDLQWGAHPDEVTEPRTRETSRGEIYKCSKSSLGSCFITLIGDKYGDSPIVTSIEVEEFELLRQAALVVSKDVTLLDSWYVQDKNAIPVAYILRTVEVKFPYYNDRTEERRAKREQDRKDWYAVRDLLKITLRAAASHAFKCGLINKTQSQRYFQSALETDVMEGLKVHSDTHRCLCFKRTIANIDISDKHAGDYIDLDGGQPDNEANDQLRTLTDITIPATLPKSNILQYTVDWQPGGLDPVNCSQHAEYLRSLTEMFVRCMRTHVKRLLRSTAIPDCHVRDELYYDVLHHAHVCNEMTQLFFGREKLLTEIKTKLQKVYHEDVALTHENKDPVQEDGKAKKENSVREDVKTKKESKYLVLQDGKFRREKVDSVEDDGNGSKENRELAMENGVSKSEDENEDDVAVPLDDGELSVAENISVTGVETDEGMSNDEMREHHLVVTTLQSYTKPIVIYGKPGSGKSTVLAMVARQATKWLRYEPIRVLRFLGTSAHTTSVRVVLQNLCKQIWEVFGITERPCTQDFSYLILYVQALLRNIKTDEENPILIILDGLDSLASDDYAHVMNWLPVRLPEHVHLVVSVTPRQHGCYDNLQKVLPDNVCYVEVPKLLPETTNNLLKIFFKESGRNVSVSQRKVIVEMALMYAQPLYVKMLVNLSRLWKSYQSVQGHEIGDTVGAIVRVLFAQLERDHGKVFVSKALGFLAIARDGVTDSQMETLLSCDNAVLQRAYSHHLPPDDTLIGFPPLLWRRLRHALEPVVTERQIDCRTLVVWRCGQFAEIAAKTYASESADQVALHAAMADYYLGYSRDAVKPLELVIKKQRVNYPDAKRRAQPQPIVFAGEHLNLRKLRHLAYHLTESHRYGDFILALCRNLEWLYYRCKAFSVCETIADFKMAADAIATDLQTPEKKGHLHKTPIVATKGHVRDTTHRNDDVVENDTPANTNENNNVGIWKKLERPNGMPEMGSRMGRVWSKVSSHMTRSVKDEDLNTLNRDDLLRVAHTQVWQVYGMLSRASDVVTRDVNNLPQQILGQLARIRDLPTGLRMLYEQAKAWVEAVNIPLVVPLTKCLPTFSPDLISSTNLNMYPTNLDTATDDNKLWLSLDGKKLFVAERRTNGDLLKELDIGNYCAVTMVQRLTHTHVNKLHLFCKDRYMSLEAHTRTDGARSELQSIIIDQETCESVPVPSDWRVIAVDDNGKYALVVNPSAHPPKELKKLTLVTVASLLHLGTQKRRVLRVTALKVTPRVIGGMFSLDGRHLVICCSDCKQHVFMTEVSRVSHTWGSNPETEVVYDDAHSMATNMHMLSRKRFLSPGLSHGVDDRVLFVRDLGVGKTLHEMRGHYYHIGIVVLNARKLLAASATTNDAMVDGVTGKHVHIWKLETGQLVARCCGVEAYSRVAFCDGHDGYLLTCTAKSAVIKMWHYEVMHKMCTDAVAVYNFVGHTSSIVYLAFTDDNMVLLSGSRDNTVKLWQFGDVVERCGEALHSSHMALPLVGWEEEPGEAPFKPSEGPIVTTCSVLTKDGQNVVVGTQNGWLIFYTVSTMAVARYDRNGPGSVHSLLATSSGHVVSTALNIVRVWDPRTGVMVRELNGTRGMGLSSGVAESQDVLAVAFGNPHHCAILWNMNTGEKLHLLHKTFGFTQVAMSRDAKLLVTDFCDQPAVFSVCTARTLPVNTDSIIATHSCTCLRISPDDRLLVTCSTDSSVKVTNLQTRVASFCLPHHSPVKVVVFTADSATLLTAGFKNILIWSMGTGQLVTKLQRHQNIINCLVFAVDEKFLVSCGEDQQIVVWDMSTTTSICSMTTDGAVSDVFVAPGLDAMLYVPTHIEYIAALTPNRMLRDIVRGIVPKVPKKIQHAQAFALTFSSQKVQCHTSQVCVIL